jgi:hypothetical protein
MNAPDLVDVIRSVGGLVTLYADGTGFRVSVPRRELVPLMNEAVSRVREVLPVLRAQEPSIKELAIALEALPPEDQAHFRFGDKLSVEDFAFYAQHIANDLIESATESAASARSQPRRMTRKVKSAQ